MNNPKVQNELNRRRIMFNAITYSDVAENISAEILKNNGFYSGQAGIYVNTEVTRGLISDDFGIAVSVRHTGRHYNDTINHVGIEYDFPTTNRRGAHDRNEILALKACYENSIPLFVICDNESTGGKTRDVYVGVVTVFDQTNSKVFIEFRSSNAFEHLPSEIHESDSDYKLNFQIHISKSLLDDDAERHQRLINAPKFPEKNYRVVIDYNRNPDVVAETLKRANGMCEQCGENSPFIRKSDNTPYLEVHHIVPLSNGGEDSVANTKALCPNCHRKMHFG